MDKDHRDPLRNKGNRNVKSERLSISGEAAVTDR